MHARSGPATSPTDGRFCPTKRLLGFVRKLFNSGFPRESGKKQCEPLHCLQSVFVCRQVDRQHDDAGYQREGEDFRVLRDPRRHRCGASRLRCDHCLHRIGKTTATKTPRTTHRYASNVFIPSHLKSLEVRGTEISRERLAHPVGLTILLAISTLV